MNMETPKQSVKIADLIKLDTTIDPIQVNNEAWNEVEQCNFILDLLDQNVDGVLRIIVTGGTIVFGREIIHAIQRYVKGEIGSHNSNLKPFEMLSEQEQSDFMKIEMDLHSVSSETVAGLFTKLNPKKV